MILQNIWREIISSVLIDISPFKYFLKLLSSEIFRQDCQAVFGNFDYNGL